MTHPTYLAPVAAPGTSGPLLATTAAAHTALWVAAFIYAVMTANLASKEEDFEMISVVSVVSIGAAAGLAIAASVANMKSGNEYAPSLGYLANVVAAVAAGAAIVTAINVFELRSLVRDNSLNSANAITDGELAGSQYAALFSFIGLMVLSRHEMALMAM